MKWLKFRPMLWVVIIFTTSCNSKITTLHVPDDHTTKLNSHAQLIIVTDLMAIRQKSFDVASESNISFKSKNAALLTRYESRFIILKPDIIRYLVDSSGNNFISSMHQPKRDLFYNYQKQLWLSSPRLPDFDQTIQDSSINSIREYKQRYFDEKIPLYLKSCDTYRDSLERKFGLNKHQKEVGKAITNYNLLYIKTHFFTITRRRMAGLEEYETFKNEIIADINSIESPYTILLSNYIIERFASLISNHTLIEMPESSEIKNDMDFLNEKFFGLAGDYIRVWYLLKAYKKNPESELKKYYASVYNPEYRKYLRKSFQHYDMQIEEIENSKKNLLINISGKQPIIINKLVESGNSNFSVLDFWASWCLPCIKAMPNNLELAKQFDSSVVKFWYVSFDKNQAAWTIASRKYEIPPQRSFRFSEKSRQSFVDENAISSIPRYVIVDRDFKVLGISDTLSAAYINQTIGRNE